MVCLSLLLVLIGFVPVVALNSLFLCFVDNGLLLCGSFLLVVGDATGCLLSLWTGVPPALALGEVCSGLAFEDACLDFAEDKDSGVADPVVVFFPGRGGLYWFLFASVDDFADEVLPRRLFCSLQNGICLSAACSLKRRLQCGHCT